MSGEPVSVKIKRGKPSLKGHVFRSFSQEQFVGEHVLQRGCLAEDLPLVFALISEASDRGLTSPQVIADERIIEVVVATYGINESMAVSR